MIFIAAPNLFKNARNFRKSAVSYFFLLRYDVMRFMLGQFILGRFLVDFGGHAESRTILVENLSYLLLAEIIIITIALRRLNLKIVL